mgnify:CR=1 FL=1
MIETLPKEDLAGRSRKGAWIEIIILLTSLSDIIVAPVRERGLK